MAVNPKTALRVAKIAKKIIIGSDDEESSKGLLIALMIPVIIVLLILSIFVYILSCPLGFILDFFVNDEVMDAVKEFKKSNDHVVELSLGQKSGEGKYPMPVSGDITSEYGYRTHPVSGEKNSFHTGIDIGAAWHSPIISIADGQVYEVGISKTYGNYVVIYHEEEEEFYSLYAHLSQVFTLPDSEVKQGQIIGLEGGDPEKDILPGRSSRHHLHFEIRTTSSPRSHADPCGYILKPKIDEDEDNKDENKDKHKETLETNDTEVKK